MDHDEIDRRAALHARADEAMAAAQAAVDAREPSLGRVVAESLEAVDLVCRDTELDPSDRLILIDEALRLLTALKGLTAAPDSARPGLLLEIVRATGDLLKRYARLVRAR